MTGSRVIANTSSNTTPGFNERSHAWKSSTEGQMTGHMAFFILAPSSFYNTGPMDVQPHHMTAQHGFFESCTGPMYTEPHLHVCTARVTCMQIHIT